MKHIILFLFLIVTFQSIAQEPRNKFSLQSEDIHWIFDWKFKAGDSLEWAKPNYIFSDWKRMKIYGRSIANQHQGNFWLKTNIRIEDTVSSRQFILHHYVMNTALEIYWDGVKIHENGKVGFKKEDEIPGNYTSWTYVPHHLLNKGIHQISVRVSNFSFPNKTLFGRFNIGSDLVMQRKNYSWALDHTVITTILGITILFCIFFFFGLSKKASLIFFIGYCFIQVLNLLINFYGFYESISLVHYNFWINILDWISFLDGFFLLAYLTYEFKLPYRKYILLGSFAVSALTYAFAFFHLPITILFAISITIYAIWLKEKTSYIVFVGLLLFAVFIYTGNQFILTWGYFIGLIILILSMILASITQVYLKLKDQHKLELRSSRLENQLLKKNIQPHFIMNSLISLQQLIYEDPDKAEEMIDSLAEEFHMFSKVSEKKLIPLKEELKICEAHLKVMEFRKDARFKLETLGVTGDEMVPPAVFHTLIENGISHGYGTKNEGLFVLKKTKENGKTSYHFFNDGEISKEGKSKKSGTGLKYVQSRLTESFGNNWNLKSGAVEGGWEVEINIDES